jgi:hypothetical protein
MPIIDPPAFQNDDRGEIPHIKITELSLKRGWPQIQSQLSVLWNGNSITNIKRAIASAGDIVWDFFTGFVPNAAQAGTTDLTAEQRIRQLQELNNGTYDVADINRYLVWLKALYPNEPINTYKIPIFDSYGYSTESQWSTNNLMSSLVSTIGSKLGPLSAVARLAPINHEMGKSFTSGKSGMKAVTVYLINDTPRNTTENLKFIHALNLASRYSHWYTQMHAPNIFEVEIPGFYYCPFSALNNLQVNSVGQFSRMPVDFNRFLELTYPDKATRGLGGETVGSVLSQPRAGDPPTTVDIDGEQVDLIPQGEGLDAIGAKAGNRQMLVPQAYKLEITFEELVGVGQELYAAGVLGTYSPSNKIHVNTPRFGNVAADPTAIFRGDF